MAEYFIDIDDFYRLVDYPKFYAGMLLNSRGPFYT